MSTMPTVAVRISPHGPLRALIAQYPALHVRVLGVLVRYAIALCALALCSPRLYICSLAGSESLMDTWSSSFGFRLTCSIKTLQELGP